MVLQMTFLNSLLHSHGYEMSLMSTSLSLVVLRRAFNIWVYLLSNTLDDSPTAFGILVLSSLQDPCILSGI
jgi:hypothetical protein